MSRELIVTVDFLSAGALDSALKAALPSKVLGVSASVNRETGRVQAEIGGMLVYGQVRVHLDDSATAADEMVIQSVAIAHDPVFLSADKQTIIANGADAVTITVNVPKPNAAPVTLLVSGTAVPVTLASGVGSIVITSADPATIAVSVQNAANRSTDQLVIQAG